MPEVITNIKTYALSPNKLYEIIEAALNVVRGNLLYNFQL